MLDKKSQVYKKKKLRRKKKKPSVPLFFIFSFFSFFFSLSRREEKHSSGILPPGLPQAPGHAGRLFGEVLVEKAPKREKKHWDMSGGAAAAVFFCIYSSGRGCFRGVGVECWGCGREAGEEGGGAVRTDGRT